MVLDAGRTTGSDEAAIFASIGITRSVAPALWHSASGRLVCPGFPPCLSARRSPERNARSLCLPSGRGCAVQRAPLLLCNVRSDSSRRVLSPMQAKISDQEDRQTRQAARSSRSSTRTAKGSKRQGGMNECILSATLAFRRIEESRHL